MSSEKIRILLLAVNPRDTKRLALDSEVREIERVIRLSDNRDSIELKTGWAVEPDDIVQLLHEHTPHIVHFSGHGAEKGELIFQEQGMAKPLTPEQLQTLFRVRKNNIRAVILNACYSHVQAQAIGQEIDFVIGMNRPIKDNAATRFAAAFYRAIGFGSSIPNAFEEGKLALVLQGSKQESIPELFVRSIVTEQKPIQVQGQNNHQQGQMVSVFSLYAKHDKKYYDQLRKQFFHLKYQKIIEEKSEQDILAGEDENAFILHHINTADIILLFISPEFFVRYELDSEELRQIKRRSQEGSAYVIPILVGEVASFKQTELGKLALLPREPEKPIGLIASNRKSRIYTDIAKDVAVVVKKAQNQKMPINFGA